MYSQRTRAVAAAACVVMFCAAKLIKMKRRRRKIWMMPHNRSREMYSDEQLFLSLVREPSGELGYFCKMSSGDFEYLLSKVEPMIAKKDTGLRKAIPANQRLAVTLRFLATGESYTTLHTIFRISSQSISQTVPVVCSAIINVLQDRIQFPKTVDEWESEAEMFEKVLNFPHCLSAIGGRHITTQAPGGLKSNGHLNNITVVLMTLVNADHCFLFADCGCQGRVKDEVILQNTNLFQNIEENQLSFPPERPLMGRNEPTPYVFIGDNTFGLSKRIMKPFPNQETVKSKIFNHRLSRAHRVVDNTFGLMASIFKVLRKPMHFQPKKVALIAMTCVLLHNFLRKSESSRSIYSPTGTFDYEEDGNIVQGTWHQADNDQMKSLLPFKKIPRKPTIEASKTRNEFARYFQTSEEKEWQD